METHEVSIVEMEDYGYIEHQGIDFPAEFHYCERADECTETEEQIAKNKVALERQYAKIILDKLASL